MNGDSYHGFMGRWQIDGDHTRSKFLSLTGLVTVCPMHLGLRPILAWVTFVGR